MNSLDRINTFTFFESFAPVTVAEKHDQTIEKREVAFISKKDSKIVVFDEDRGLISLARTPERIFLVGHGHTVEKIKSYFPEPELAVLEREREISKRKSALRRAAVQKLNRKKLERGGRVGENANEVARGRGRSDL